MKLGLIAVGALILVGCVPEPCPVPPPFVPPLDAGIPDAFTPDPLESASYVPRCNDACVKLRAFACPEGEATYTGTTCTSVCVRNYKSLPVDCVMRATSREAVVNCGVRCKP